VIKLNSWFNQFGGGVLITRAARYRALAAGVTDEQTQAGLLELAKKYEALAREMKADDPPEAQ
jgi:hypothetical protein